MHWAKGFDTIKEGNAIRALETCVLVNSNHHKQSTIDWMD